MTVPGELARVTGAAAPGGRSRQPRARRGRLCHVTGARRLRAGAAGSGRTPASSRYDSAAPTTSGRTKGGALGSVSCCSDVIVKPAARIAATVARLQLQP